MNPWMALMAVGLTVSASLHAASQTDLDRQVQGLNESVAYIRGLIARSGTVDAQELDAKVHFQVAESVVPLASSGREATGIPQIQISTQYRLILVYMTELEMVAAADPSLTPCVIEYRMMLEETFANNATRVGTKQPPLDSPAPEIYAIATKADCKRLQTLLPIALEQRGNRDRQVLMAIAFTYLHELGHLALNHPGKGAAVFVGAKTDAERRERFLEATKHSRKEELEADAWAVRQMSQLGAHPLEILSSPLMDMLMVMTGVNCFFRLGMDHPDTLSRLTAIMQVIRSEHKRSRGQSLPQPVEAMFSDVVALNRKSEQTLRCPKDD